MKYSFILLASVKLMLNARPTFEGSGKTQRPGPPLCMTGKFFCDDVLEHSCALAGQQSWAYWPEHDCSTFGYGYASFTKCCGKENCTEKICVKGAKVSGGIVECVNVGGSYESNYSSLHHTSESECCSGRGVSGGNNECACALVGTPMTEHGAKATDCCSGTLDDKKACAPRPCTKKGQAPTDAKRCCGSMSDGHNQSSNDPEGKCTCIHAGAEPSTEDDVDVSNCCSGTFESGSSRCKCINDKERLEFGAVAADCCSGEATDEGKHCKASKCSEVGHKLRTAEHCCSESAGADKVCRCLAPGTALPAGARPRVCCSGRADADGKCEYLMTGETPRKETDASVCFSGEITATGQCSCVHDGKKSKQDTQCCSKVLAEDNQTCGCAWNGKKLTNGGVESDCCSRYVDTRKGTCGCGPPGFPSRADHGGAECCSGTTTNGFCGCFDKSGGAALNGGRFCCGGLYNESSLACRCIKVGTAVASYVHDGACCSGGNKNGICSI